MAASDLVSLANVKLYLGITDGTDDALLGLLITGVSGAFVRAAGGADILKKTYAETRDGDGGAALVLRRTPVVSVASVTVDGSTVTQATGSGDGWFLDDDVLRLRGSTFRVGIGNVVVTYDAGLAADVASLPAEVSLAVLEAVAWRYRGKEHIGEQSRTSSLSGVTTSYQGTWATEQTQDGLPASTLAIARSCRRPGV